MPTPVAENPATRTLKLGGTHATKFLNPQITPPQTTTNLSSPILTVPPYLSTLTMSRPMCRLFTQRLGASTRLSAPARTLLRNPAGRRFASGESGPNPKPGQNPFKVWPFVAITLLGTGSYILMARSRDGSCTLTSPSPGGGSESWMGGSWVRLPGSKRRVIQAVVAA